MILQLIKTYIMYNIVLLHTKFTKYVSQTRITIIEKRKKIEGKK